MSSEKFKFEFAEEDALENASKEQLEIDTKKQSIERAKDIKGVTEETATEGETFLAPDAEDDQEISALTSGVAGIFSGAIKTIEGIPSITAELMDLGGGALLNVPSTKDSAISAAASVEQFFDKINIFEDAAQERATGKIAEAIVQIGSYGTAGAKIALKATDVAVRKAAEKIAKKAIKAKKANRYMDLKNPNLQKGAKKVDELNRLSGKQKLAAISVGGATGETFVVDNEAIGTFGDLFQGGPTELDRDVRVDPADDAARKLLNRLKFGSESLLLTPLVYGVGKSAKILATRGKELAYSNKKIEKTLDTLGGFFRPRGRKPQEIFLAKRKQSGREMADLNFAKEQVNRIDKEVNKMFPTYKSLNNKTVDDDRGVFLKELNDLMFEGDFKKGIPDKAYNTFLKSSKNKGASSESINTMVESIENVRSRMDELFDITAQGPADIKMIKKVQTNLRNLMGDRVKQYLGTTYKIFENNAYNFFDRYKASSQSVEKVKDIFKRYAAKNKNPITDEQAEELVSNILSQARQYNAKSKLPSFTYDNRTLGAMDPVNTKTFARTLERELPDGTKELKVVGKGSKAFRELFGEVEDARHSIFQGINDLSIIARKNQLFDEILDVDEAMKAKVKPDTPPGQRGFFFDSPIAARNALPNNEIVKIDPYVSELFKDGVLINRLQGTYTTKDIAESFSNAAKISQFMRGESGGKLGEYASWAWRNLFLTPKAFSQFAKTVLSVPTHFRNFFSSAGFSISNGIVLDPVNMAKGMNEARKLVQVGMRSKEANEKYRRLLELGVTNSNTRMGDLKNLMRDAKVFENGNVATDSVLKPMIQSLGKIGEVAGRAAKKTGEVMQDAYVAEDDFWKIVAYETEFARLKSAYEKSGMKIGPNSIRKLEEEAADIVRNTIPNYAYVGEFVRTMRVTPFGNFMSWPSEVFRTGYGIMERAIKEIKDPVTGKINPITSTNPLKGIGMKRLIGAVTAFGVLPYGIVKGVQSINGVSDEEADAGRDFVAPWSKDSQILWFKDPETGELYYSDWSSNNVYDTLTRPFQTVLRNIQEGIEDEEILLKGFVKGITQSAAQVSQPFIGESIFTEAVGDIVARGGRTKEGSQLYTEQTPGNEKFKRILKHIAETQAPQYKQYGRIIDSITGKPDNNGDVLELDKQLAGLFGFRMIKLRPDKGLEYYITDYTTGKRNSTREFTGGPEGVLKPAKSAREVIERYFVANQSLFNVHRNMKRHINNARKLKLSEDDIAETFRKRGNTRDYIFLEDNAFKPYYPGKGVQEKFEEIAVDTGLPNPFEEAAPIIDKMYDAFSDKLLTDPEFEFKLEDFLPQPAADVTGQQSALPPQPMPDPSVVGQIQQNQPMQGGQQFNTSQGLTPTEMALLSPEEQQMRLKQRGLV